MLFDLALILVMFPFASMRRSRSPQLVFLARSSQGEHLTASTMRH
jgi:hypothetical protein